MESKDKTKRVTETWKKKSRVGWGGIMLRNIKLIHRMHLDPRL